MLISTIKDSLIVDLHNKESVIVDLHNKDSLVVDLHNKDSLVVDLHNKDFLAAYWWLLAAGCELLSPGSWQLSGCCGLLLVSRQQANTGAIVFFL